MSSDGVEAFVTSSNDSNKFERGGLGNSHDNTSNDDPHVAWRLPARPRT